MTDRLFSLDGRVALVTGASSGLGVRFAKVLAQAGAKVALAARRGDRLVALAEELRADGARALPIELDVSDSAQVARAVEEVETELGPLRILVNNAGMAKTAPALETPGEDWDQVMDVNLRGAWMMAQAAGKAMAVHGQGGSIVNIASILGLGGTQGVAAYCASKAGLINLTRALAGEWARHGIRVNALAPGYIETELNSEWLSSKAGEAVLKRIPQRRFGQAEDLDGPLLLLAGDAGGFMTGSVLVVDGGHSSIIL
jgi:NAD(P)-dependent dehydrogenase (short-subunit alcohol dehydrogenase family)